MAMAIIAFSVLFSLMLACARALQSDMPVYWSAAGSGLAPEVATSQAAAKNASVINAEASVSSGPVKTPTPDDAHPLPPMRSEVEVYTVQRGDTLGEIAKQYGVSIGLLTMANGITNPNLLEVGQVLTIPVPDPSGPGPSFKIIPDSELVYSPSSVGFDITQFVNSRGGYISQYYEDIGGIPHTGAQVIERVAQDYSIHPRLLLALVEYQSGWVTQANPQKVAPEYPLGLVDNNRKGLYLQLAWAANSLNQGYYMWRVNGVSSWLLGDGNVVPIDPTINAGTAAVQHLFASLYDEESWRYVVTENGLFATFQALFGYPFDYAIEPLIPADLTQPTLQLPFEPGQEWAFTGGPHGGWGSGSAWAALDFAPPGEALGCVQSDAWVVAAADGLIIRAGGGAVIQDLDGDGNEQTGWALLYMHVESRDRVQPGTYLKAGERVGHPSCEGGVSTGTHVHFARKYNGEWIAADQEQQPFNLDGWISEGSGFEYNGTLYKDGESIEAYAGRSPDNGIQR
jgi:LasA protease